MLAIDDFGTEPLEVMDYGNIFYPMTELLTTRYERHLFPDNDEGDRYMAQLVDEWLRGMGIINAQYIVARHFDKAHPHCHLVYSRIAAANSSSSWAEFEHALEAHGIEASFSISRSTGEIRGISFAKDSYRFAGSKLSKQKLTYGKLIAKFGALPVEEVIVLVTPSINAKNIIHE